MTGSTYDRYSWGDVQSNSIAPNSVGSTGNALANQDTNLDIQLTDDVFIRAIELITMGASMGDWITLQIVDANGIFGVPPGTVVATPVYRWNVMPGTNILTYESVTPKKAVASLILRAIYHNTALLTQVSVGLNYNLLKILS